MDKLSAEVLLIIFKDLQFREKLECMLVCRAWANLLRDGHLFESIVISNETTFQASDKYLLRLIKKAKSGTCPGKKCTSLRIYSFTESRLKGDALATSFPNLKFLYYHYDLTYSPKGRCLRSSTIEPDPFKGWRASLETLIERHDMSVFIPKILATGVFENLTTLIAKPKDMWTDPYSTKFISALKNAPKLTTLDTSFFSPSVMYLEELHKNAPELISLTLSFVVESDEIITHIISPAKKLKILRMKDFPSSISCQNAFLTYIKLKYTCLDELHFQEGDIWKGRADFPDSKWNELSSTIGARLKKLTIDLQCYSDQFFDNIIRYTDQLESLSLRLDMDEDIFERVMRSKQFYGLRSLSLFQLPLFDCDFSYFKNLNNLNELHLGFPRTKIPVGVISLEDVVKKLPKSVQIFSTRDAELTVAKKVVRSHSNIVQLKLYRTSCDDKKFSNYLSQHFPKLNHLVLDTCAFNDTLELPNHHLRYLEYRPSVIPCNMLESCCSGSIGEPNKQIAHLQITTPNTTSYYNIPTRENDYHDFAACRFALPDDYELKRVLKASGKSRHLKYFQLKCAAVDTLYFKDSNV